DPASPAESRIAVTIDTGSAKTGDAMYDGTLPSPDWFDVKNHKKASFLSTSVSRSQNGSYIAYGDLSIRGKTKTVHFPFTLEQPENGATTRTQFTLPLHRLDFGIGEQSDPKAEWVDDLITVTVTLEAKPK
ncbi:MAG: YceI family protein, partial [Alphaproteobacteria bacterium]|nr:YceI family protein [Alphaproteobacteria bacterium]